jgi:hypothetical protein
MPPRPIAVAPGVVRAWSELAEVWQYGWAVRPVDLVTLACSVEKNGHE